MGQILFADAIHRVEQAKIDGARKTQAANNEKGAAESELQRFSANLGNRRRMDAAGSHMASIAGNISKNIDAKAAGDLNTQISLAEELGASATMAGAAGVGGGSVEAYNSTVRLRASMSDEQNGRAFHQDLYAAHEDIGNTFKEAVAGLDNNSYRANLDYRQYVDHHKMSAFQQIATIGLAAAATYFGGPKAGMAVVQASEGINQAQNGQYDQAGASLTGAVSSGYGSFSDTRAVGGNYWKSTRAVHATPQLSGATKRI